MKLGRSWDAGLRDSSCLSLASLLPVRSRIFMEERAARKRVVKSGSDLPARSATQKSE